LITVADLFGLFLMLALIILIKNDTKGHFRDY
jgi:hypothetical protein